MLHPDTEVRFISPEMGSGVFATRLIPRGTVVWVQDRLDRVYQESDVRAMAPVYQEILEKYCFRNRNGEWVFCWDNTRFINHSFKPTNMTTPYQFELAICDIQPGQQMTNDYGYFNIIEPFECLPEPGSERCMVMPDDLLHHHQEWDLQLAEAFSTFDRLEQPLSHLIGADYLELAGRIARGECQHDSILNCFFGGGRA